MCRDVLHMHNKHTFFHSSTLIYRGRVPRYIDGASSARAEFVDKKNRRTFQQRRPLSTRWVQLPIWTSPRLVVEKSKKNDVNYKVNFNV